MLYSLTIIHLTSIHSQWTNSWEQKNVVITAWPHLPNFICHGESRVYQCDAWCSVSTSWIQLSSPITLPRKSWLVSIFYKCFSELPLYSVSGLLLGDEEQTLKQNELFHKHWSKCLDKIQDIPTSATFLNESPTGMDKLMNLYRSFIGLLSWMPVWSFNICDLSFSYRKKLNHTKFVIKLIAFSGRC